MHTDQAEKKSSWQSVSECVCVSLQLWLAGCSDGLSATSLSPVRHTAGRTDGRTDEGVAYVHRPSNVPLLRRPCVCQNDNGEMRCQATGGPRETDGHTYSQRGALARMTDFCSLAAASGLADRPTCYSVRVNDSRLSCRSICNLIRAADGLPR